MFFYYPFGMMMVGRSFSASEYRFGFNGKENDNEVKGQGSQQDYGMRIYAPRLGRFLSIDPLTNSYPWYTPYQFAGNSPVKFVDLDGLEEGELEIHKEEPKTATLTWRKVYTVVTDGNYKVHSAHKIEIQEVSRIYNSGQNVIYTNKLPGSKNADGQPEQIKLMKRRDWKKGNAYKIYIRYDIRVEEGACTFRDAQENVNTNPTLNGVIMDETGVGGKNLKLPTAAAGTVGATGTENDLIYTNDEVFGAAPTDINVTQHGADEPDLIAHEIGHNFGLTHADHAYTQDGLMSNKQGIIRPTKENNVEIINKNAKNIKQK
jgi:RHS repeat-associated protein